MFCPNFVKNQNVCPRPSIFSPATTLCKSTFSSWADIKKTFIQTIYFDRRSEKSKFY